MTAGIGDYVADNKHKANWPMMSESLRNVEQFRVDHFMHYPHWPEWARCKTMATLVNYRGSQIDVSLLELDKDFFVTKTREEVVAERLLA